MSAPQSAQKAFEIARQRRTDYGGCRRILLDNLSFVREDAPDCWIDLAPVRLGSRLVPH